MRIKPIPLCLLNSSVIYKPYIGEGRHGKVWGNDLLISDAALSYTARYSVSGESQYLRHNAVLFYDCTNSKPKGIKFQEQGLIIHDGRKMVIERVVIPNWRNSLPHHYELELFDIGKGR